MNLRISSCFKRALCLLPAFAPFFLPAQGIEEAHDHCPDPELAWELDFRTIFDNREGDSRLTDTRTFFQTQLCPEIGVEFEGGRHRLMGGVAWTQPIGTPWREGTLKPTLYYLYDGRTPGKDAGMNGSDGKDIARKGVAGKSYGVRGALGSVPRRLLERPMPNYVWSDSSYYSQANIAGGFVSYSSRLGWAEGLLDWRGIQTESRREAFNIILRGEYAPEGRLWVAGGLAMMNHFALTRNSPEYEHIVDNFLVNPYVGVDLSHRWGADSLRLVAGALGSLTRNRGDRPGGWKAPFGFWLEGNWRWKRLGIDNTLYLGGPLFPYYSEFGALLDQGEPYYRSGWYERATVSLALVRSSHIDLRAALDVNLARSNFTFYQRLLLEVRFGSD